MDNNFGLQYSPEFLNDFDNIIQFIKYDLNNVIATNHLLLKVEKAIKNRLKNPLGYEKYKTNGGNIYYTIYINHFIIFYTVNENIMNVRRMVYYKRNIDEIIY